MNTDKTQNKFSFFGHSQMGILARSIDWEKHPLGSPENWPAELKLALNIVLHSKLPMFISWGKQRHFFYNDAYSVILGKKHPSAFGDEFHRIWSEIWKDIEPLVNSVDHGEGVYLEDLKLIMNRHGADEETFFTFSYSPLFSDSGEVLGLYCAAIETTARMNAEASLEAERFKLVQSRNNALASEARLQTLAETIPQLAWQTDGNGSATYFNLNWTKKTGVSLAKSLGDQWVECIHPDDRDNTLKNWKKSVADKSDFSVEYRVRMADGSFRWHLSRAVPVRNPNGEIEEWVGAATDIDDQKRAKVEYERSVDVSPSILWITGVDGSCSYLSKKWFEFTGQTEEEALGFGWLAATHPDDKQRTADVYVAANAAQKPFYAEYRLRTKDGTYRWAIDAGNPRFDQDGKYLGYAGSVFDIHDLKMFEEELKGALRSRDEFLSIASHELKTPLTSLKIQAQLNQRLLKRNDPQVYSPENVASLVQLTDKQVSRLTRLVDDMLDVSRIRSGHLRIEREEFDLRELAQEVIERLKGQFENSSSSLPQLIFSGDLRGSWDRLRLEQVVTNLLTNAIRYGNKNEVVVNLVSLGANVRLSVIDKGIGISESARERIFDRFERSINSNEVSGLGLGLFITKQIVLAHDGKIWVESELGKGSQFHIELPKSGPEKEVPHEL